MIGSVSGPAPSAIGTGPVRRASGTPKPTPHRSSRQVVAENERTVAPTVSHDVSDYTAALNGWTRSKWAFEPCSIGGWGNYIRRNGLPPELRRARFYDLGPVHVAVIMQPDDDPWKVVDSADLMVTRMREGHSVLTRPRTLVRLP